MSLSGNFQKTRRFLRLAHSNYPLRNWFRGQIRPFFMKLLGGEAKIGNITMGHLGEALDKNKTLEYKGW